MSVDRSGRCGQTIILAETPNRYLAGIEVSLKKVISDKTHWQKMLKNDVDDSINLIDLKHELIRYLPDDLKPYVVRDEMINSLEFPVLDYPQKVKA